MATFHGASVSRPKGASSVAILAQANLAHVLTRTRPELSHHGESHGMVLANIVATRLHRKPRPGGCCEDADDLQISPCTSH